MFGEVMLGCNFTVRGGHKAFAFAPSTPILMPNVHLAHARAQLVRSKELPRGGYVKPAKEDKDKDAGSSPARQVKSEAYVESSGDEAQEAPKQRRGKAKGGPSDDEREEEEGVGSGSMALAKIAQQKKGQALSSSRQPKASNSSKRDNVDPESSEDEYDKLQAKKKRKVNRSASGDKKKTGKDMLWQ